ncbi:hypothetical protein OEB96_44800 [Paraliomyxa miuraensis]|nr:hypothetical protein [Paraliomyxa miuraensis]
MYHTEPRYTKDLDIFVDAAFANCERLKRALEEFAGPLPQLTVEELADKRRVLMMGRPPVRIDVLKAIDGVRFETAWKNRTRASFGGTRVNLIGRRDLIRNKRASGRPRDLLDLDALTGLDR